MFYTYFESLFGRITAAANDTAIVFLGIGDEAMTDARFIALDAVHHPQHPLFMQLETVIEHPALQMTIPIGTQGTPLQQQVWKTLRNIPTGGTLSYSVVAAQIGNPKAVRAVAAACGANPVSLLIPCHRVVGKNGKLTGYRWGLVVKQALLSHEKAALAKPLIA